MEDVLESVADHARKPAYALTRRDVARWLVQTPDARATLPALRRALMAAGLPLSAVFWESAEALLMQIESGAATIGDVQRWLEDTGSHPIALVGMHVWEDDGHRMAVADRLYGELVDHLERLVMAGDIDPDRLLAGDPDAREAYRQEQERWLDGPLPDGRTRVEALDDEKDGQFLDEWAEADSEAFAVLEEVLEAVGERPCPGAALRAACDRLRTALGSGRQPYDLLATCLGNIDLPAGDETLWLALATAVLQPREEPPERYATELIAAWYARLHADWLCVTAELARRGPGTPAEANDLAEYLAVSDVVEGELDDDEVELVASGFFLVVELWQALGAVDADGRLTPLGWWGLPEAQRRAWASGS